MVERVSNVQSVERAFSILRVLASGPAGVSDIAESTDLPKSTVSRLLTSIVDVGAVERMDLLGVYGLGEMVVELGASASPGRNLVAIARPYLQQLVDDLGEAAGLGMLDEHLVYYYDQVDADHDVQVRDWTGETVDFHVVPSGLVLAADADPDTRERLLAGPLEAWTEQSVTDRSQLERRLADIRQVGFAWVYEEMSEGINSVAAPIVNPAGAAVAAIHAHGPSYRFPGDGEAAAIAARVVAAARAVSDRLAGRMTDEHEALAG